MGGLNDFHNHPCNRPTPKGSFCILKPGHEGEHEPPAPSVVSPEAPPTFQKHPGDCRCGGHGFMIVAGGGHAKCPHQSASSPEARTPEPCPECKHAIEKHAPFGCSHETSHTTVCGCRARLGSRFDPRLIPRSSGGTPGEATPTFRVVPTLIQNEDERMLHELANVLLVHQPDPFNPHRYPDFLRGLATRLRAVSSKEPAPDERELCARVCESRAKSLREGGQHGEANEAKKCAAAIRARLDGSPLRPVRKSAAFPVEDAT